MKNLLMTAAICLGIVDQIYDGYIVIEYKTIMGEIRYLDVPIDAVPCKISEGDSINFLQSSTHTKIFCNT